MTLETTRKILAKQRVRVITELREAYEALEHIAIHGWGRAMSDDGVPNSPNKGSSTKHDPLCLKKLNVIDQDLKKIANLINGFVRTREIEVRGCTPYEDCKDVVGWKCGNLTSDGECRIKR